MIELEQLERLKEEGIKCFVCGDTGTGYPTLAEPGGESCPCVFTDSIAYMIEHYDEILEFEKSQVAESNKTSNEIEF